MKIKLEIMSGAMDGQEFRYNRSLTIGREKTNELVLNLDKYISRRHARMLIQDPDVYVEDLGSTNGTFVRGEKVHTREILSNEELFRVGRTWMQVSW